MVVLSQPGQAGDREAVVVLVNGEGYDPLDQPLDLGRDGLLLGHTGHMRTLAPSPDGPAPRSADKQMQGQEFDVGAGHAAAHTYASSLALVISLTVIPPGPAAADQTALNGMPSQPELPRAYWSGLSGRLAVMS
jgi:hypothetical protein